RRSRARPGIGRRWRAAWWRDGGSAPRRLDRQIGAVAPLVPRPDVAPHARIAGDAQRHPALRRAVAALAVGDHLALRGDAERLVHRPDLARRTVAAVAGEVRRVLEVHRARDGPAAR